jgi:protein involved in polysaccharide export with SLBB domain
MIVPRKPLRVSIFGEAQRQGELAIGAQDRVLDAFLQVGASPNADPTRAELIRRGPDGKPITQKLNLQAAMKGETRHNVALQADDVLFIPGKRGPKRGVLDYVGALASPLWLLNSTLF